MKKIRENTIFLILKRAREVEQHDGPLPMRVNNQRLFQEFALQTPKTKPKGFVRDRKVKYPCPLNSFAVFSGIEPPKRFWVQGLPWGMIPSILTILMITTSISGVSGSINNDNNYPDWSDATHGNTVDPDYSLVFNQNEVLRFDIRISSEDWAAMQNNLSDNLGAKNEGPAGAPGNRKAGGPGNRSVGDPAGKSPGIVGAGAATLEVEDNDPIMVPCSFNFNGTEWYNVGIRYKGNSSLRSSYTQGIGKLSFKLDFDEFEDGYPELDDQRFYGFKQLNLKNNYDDTSLMREKVAADLFRDFGLISPQVSFCEVYVDYGSGSQYFGLYTLVEEVDDTVLENQLGDDSGNLYKPDGEAASFAYGTYDDSEMEKKNNDEEADYSDVKALYSIINSNNRVKDRDQWKIDLETVFNVDGFLKWLAANTVMQNWDTYGNMTHNYYLYNNQENNQLNWIPWDNNESLQYGKGSGAISLSLSEIGENWPLIRYLIDDSEYKQIYEAYMFQFINEVFTSENMIKIYTNFYDLLKEYAYAEVPGYTFLRSDIAFDSAVDTLKSHVQNRIQAVESYLQ